MPQEIEKHYVDAFRRGIEQAFQQSTSRFRPFVEIERQASEFEFYDRIGVADDMQEDTTRYGDNPVNEIPHDRRRIGLKDYDLGKPIDEKDLIRVAMDPSNAYTQAMVASGNRKIDDVIIDTIFTKAFVGKKGESEVEFVDTTSEKITVGELSSGHGRAQLATGGDIQIDSGAKEGIDVAVNYVQDGSPVDSGMTLDKLKGIRRTMLSLEAIQQDTILNCFQSAKEFNDLLNTEEVINADYSIRKNLAEGNVTEFMGFRFIHSERLIVEAGVRQCIVSLPQAFKLAVSRDLDARIWRLTGQKLIPYIYLRLGLGGSRMWGEVTARVNTTE